MLHSETSGSSFRKTCLRLTLLAPIAAMAMLPVASHAQEQTLLNGQNIGTVGGAVAGGLVGNKLGGKKHKTLGTIAGVVGGAVAGRMVGNMVDNRNSQYGQPMQQAMPIQADQGIDPQATGSIANDGTSGLLNGRNIGAVGGAIAGGIAGNKLSGKKHKTSGTIAGAVGGGLLGGVVGNMVGGQ
jgi:outer membrane lipoprotein SlyB